MLLCTSWCLQDIRKNIHERAHTRTAAVWEWNKYNYYSIIHLQFCAPADSGRTAWYLQYTIYCTLTRYRVFICIHIYLYFIFILYFRAGCFLCLGFMYVRYNNYVKPHLLIDYDMLTMNIIINYKRDRCRWVSPNNEFYTLQHRLFIKLYLLSFLSLNALWCHCVNLCVNNNNQTL